MENFWQPHNVVSAVHDHNAFHHKLTIKKPPRNTRFSQNPLQKHGKTPIPRPKPTAEKNPKTVT